MAGRFDQRVEPGPQILKIGGAAVRADAVGSSGSFHCSNPRSTRNCKTCRPSAASTIRAWGTPTLKSQPCKAISISKLIEHCLLSESSGKHLIFFILRAGNEAPQGAARRKKASDPAQGVACFLTWGNAVCCLRSGRPMAEGAPPQGRRPGSRLGRQRPGGAATRAAANRIGGGRVNWVAHHDVAYCKRDARG